MRDRQLVWWVPLVRDRQLDGRTYLSVNEVLGQTICHQEDLIQRMCWVIQMCCTSSIPQIPGSDNKDFGPIILFNWQKTSKQVSKIAQLGMHRGICPAKSLPDPFHFLATPHCMNCIFQKGFTATAQIIVHHLLSGKVDYRE